MDPIASKVTEKFVEQSLQQGAGGGPGAASTADQLRFEQALNQPAEGQGVDPAQGVEQAGQAQDPSAVGQVGGAEPTLGDTILNGIEKLKSSHDVRLERIEQTISESGGEMTIDQMMKLQFEVMQLGIEQDLTTKVADKTSQGVQTLFRNQG